MKDPRLLALARTLVRYSCSVQSGEHVLIEDRGIAPDFDTALIREIYAAGGIPAISLMDGRVDREMLRGCTAEGLDWLAEHDAARMRSCQAYIGIRGGDNSCEGADVPPDKKALYNLHYNKPVHGRIRAVQTKWVVLRYPTRGMAQQAGMSTEAFEDFFFEVCCMDYGRMSAAMDALVTRMQRTDRVRITGNGTDLSFSTKGLPVIKCDGRLNIPDGEVFTAPVKDSVEGIISYNTPSLYQGVTYENIVLKFSKGRVISAFAGGENLDRIFDTDEGARFVGEFAIGVNPYITRPMKDTLFDEKIAGSFHFTPGNSYDECDNGNKSAIHWDLVCIQTPAYGGGEIWFDDEMVRKDGLFVPESLTGLNPDALLSLK